MMRLMRTQVFRRRRTQSWVDGLPPEGSWERALYEAGIDHVHEVRFYPTHLPILFKDVLIGACEIVL